MAGLKEMMTKLEEASPKAASGGSGAAWRNVALRVTGYDIEKNLTHGVDISTGEQISIRLDDANRRDSRDDVAVWSQQRAKIRNGYMQVVAPKAVEAGDKGGVIIFDAVHPGKDGVLESRWGNTASHMEGVAEVFVAYARPMSWKGQLSDARGIELIRPAGARPVESMADMKSAVDEIMINPFANAIIRGFDGTDVVAGTVARRFDREAKKLESAESAWTRFLEQDTLGKLLSDEIFAGNKFEVMSLEKVYPGADYKKTLTDPSKVDARVLARDWALPDGSGTGFSSTIVAIRTHEEGGSQLTKIRPESTRPLLYVNAADIPTANIQPAVTPIALASTEPVAAASPAAAPDETGVMPEKDRVADGLASIATASKSFQQRP